MCAARLAFVSILGEPGTYCPSVYEDIGGDNECAWFMDTFRTLPGVDIVGHRVSHGEPIPEPREADLFVLGGSYNSVHDDFPWQRALYRWFDRLREAGRPLLAICGGHQMLAAHHGAPVVSLDGAPVAGTEAVELTEAGRASPLFTGIGSPAHFHFANGEQVASLPSGAALLAAHPRLPYAALDYGERWFSTQFHPEATAATLSRSWLKTRPEFASRYHADSAGYRLVANFVALCGGS